MRPVGFVRGVLCAVVAAAVVTGGSLAAGLALDEARALQKKRAATMKAINKGMRRIKVFSAKGEMARVAAAAEEVARLVAQIPALSPKGSDVGNTRIKPAVWKEFPRYKQLSARTVAAARALARTARRGEEGAVRAGFKGLARSCSACHKPFRAKKKPRR